MRVQQHEYPANAAEDCVCGVSGCPILMRDSTRLSCILRDLPAVARVAPTSEFGFGFPNIDLDALRKIREEGDAALNHIDPAVAG